MFRRGNPRRVYTSLVPSLPMAKRLLFAPKIARVRAGRVLVFSMILHKRIGNRDTFKLAEDIYAQLPLDQNFYSQLHLNTFT